MAKITLDQFIKTGAFNQKAPCNDCPFRKKGGVRYGLVSAFNYMKYFVTYPGRTFPCHKSVPAEIPRDQWSEWQPGQVLCAGGLIFAKKQGEEYLIMKIGIERGVYDPNQHLEEDSVFDTPEEMLSVAEDFEEAEK